MFVVARTKYAVLRLLLKLLLLSSIVNANLGAVSQTEIPNAIASTALPPAATISAADYATSQLLASSSEASATAETQHPSAAAASRETLVNVYDYGLNDRAAVNDIGSAIDVGDNDGNIASATDMVEEHGGDESEFFAPTVATSIEQQDQPMVPPTTLSFANVVPVKNLADDSGATSTTLDYASPPYEAVDDKYVPSKPLNLTVLDVSSNSITMSWHPPKNQNGAIAGYHVFHIHENQTGVEIVKNVRNSVETTITFALPNLRPFTEYRVIVKAFTTKNEGDPSDQIVQRTDVAGPSAPIVVNVTCHSQESITIRWKRPYEFYNTIDFYIIKARLQGQDSHRDIRINASAKELESAMILQNLTTNSVYEVKVAAATFSVINPKKIILGKFSEAKKIPLQPNCEKLQPQLRQSHNDYNLAVLVGIIFSCFGIILIVMAFFLWSRKCFHAAYYYLDDPPHHPNVPQVDWEVPVEVGGEIRAAVPVNEFGKHVASLHADGDIGFSREYEAIQNECVSDDMPCENSLHPENKRKNRYLNITAYDHSRVHLHPTTGQKKSLDYINANFIDGYQKSRAFIGTQGPLPETFDCFWRMIWEQRVVIIVMITNLVERGRRKCDMYWPKDGTDTYGVIQVKLIEEEVMSTYTVRTLQIKHMKLKKKKQCNSEKIVYQYHYTNWPDHGTPDHPLPVLNFVKKSSAANPPDAGPIVVHCSAGVGRTGTYIVLDAMLKQIQQKGVVNVFGFLRHIRIQRNFLVQTEEQYIFLHDALVEAIASGETNLRAEQIEELKNCTPYLENQYRNIIQFQTKDIHIASAMKQVNSIKNRGAIFPIEGSRVHLTPKPGEEGSDYINASWLHGFRRLRDFIVTQHPMSHTLKDFWQMVWDHNAQTIVLLSSLDEINFAQFWADEATPIESDYYRVKYLNKTNKSDYVSRDFVIQSIQDDYELTVKMLHCPSWPEMSNPNSIYDFIVDVHERCNDYRNGPIVVVDRYGGAQACTFCAISSLAIEMEYCNTANVYQYAKLYHNKRPGVWTSSEDIRLIYNILSFLPPNLQLLKRTALRTEFEDVTTVTPDLYSKICSNGNIQNHNNSSFTNSQNSSNCLNNQLINQINQNNLISQSVPSNQNQNQNIAFNNPSQPPKQSQSPTPSSQTPPPLQRPPSPLPTSPPQSVVMSPTQITTAINPLTNTNVDNLNTNTNAATINMNGEWTNTSVPSSTTSSMNGDVQQLQLNQQQQQQLQQQNQQIQQQQQQQQQYQHQQMMALMNRQNQLQLQQQHQQQPQHQSPYIISPTNMVQHCGDDDAFVLPTAQTILTTSSPSPPSSPSLPPSPQSTLHFVDTENVARDSNCISSAPNTPLVGDGYAPLLTSNNSFSSSSSSSSTNSPNAHAQPPISDCCSGSGSSSSTTSSSTSSSTTSALSTSLTNGISNAHDNQTTVVTDAQNLDIVG